MIKLKINFLVISSQLKTVRIELSQTENKGKQSQNKPLLFVLFVLDYRNNNNNNHSSNYDQSANY